MMQQIRMKNPIFNAIQVDRKFLDNPPSYVRLIRFAGREELTVNGIEIAVGDWIVENHYADGELVYDVIAEDAFDAFYEVIA